MAPARATDEPDRAAVVVVGGVEGVQHLECAGQRRRGGLRIPPSSGSRTRRGGCRPPAAGPGPGARRARPRRPPARRRSSPGRRPTRGHERLEVRLARGPGVERLEAPGGAEKQPSSVAAALLHARRSARAGAPPRRSAWRPEARPRPRSAARAPHPPRRRRAWHWRRRAGAQHGERDRASASPRARGTRPPRPNLRELARGRPTARVPRRPARRAPASRGRGARRDGRDRASESVTSARAPCTACRC